MYMDDGTKQHTSSALSLLVFRRYLTTRRFPDGAAYIDASQVTSRACFEDWLASRPGIPPHPEKKFQRYLTSHLTGADGRRFLLLHAWLPKLDFYKGVYELTPKRIHASIGQPFTPEEEAAILKVIRMKQKWPAFSGLRECTIGQMGFRTLGYHEKKSGLILPPLPLEVASVSPTVTASHNSALQKADGPRPISVALFSGSPPALPPETISHPPKGVKGPNPQLVGDVPNLCLPSPQSPLSSRLSPVPFDFSSFWDCEDDDDDNEKTDFWADEELDFLTRELFTGTKRLLPPLTVEADRRVFETMGSNDLMPDVFRTLIDGIGQRNSSPKSELTSRYQVYFGPTIRDAIAELGEFDALHPNLLSIAVNFSASYQEDLILAQNDASVVYFGRVAKSHHGTHMQLVVAADRPHFFRHMLYVVKNWNVEVHFTVGINFLTGQRVSRVTLMVKRSLMLMGVEMYDSELR